ncbi:MAG: hypothetical protein QOF70_2556, partial [Acetobacteraceae bacterium]|nr:hypothetical protein [Acetobacteraceae bacterium]
KARRRQHQGRLALHRLQPSGDGLQRLLHLAQRRAVIGRTRRGLLALAVDLFDPAPQRRHLLSQRLERPASKLPRLAETR